VNFHDPRGLLQTVPGYCERYPDDPLCRNGEVEDDNRPLPDPPPFPEDSFIPEGECILALKYRPLDGAGGLIGFSHAYLWVKDRWGNVVTIEGFPEHTPAVPFLGDYGRLIIENSVNGARTTNAARDSGWGPVLVNALSAGISGQNKITVWDLCDRIDRIFWAEIYYMADPVEYRPVGGPNSNSLAHWFLIQVDLWVYFSAPPGTAGIAGWDTPLRR
jgi:hypothetical protein